MKNTEYFMVMGCISQKRWVNESHNNRINYSEAYFPKAKFIDDPIGKKFIEEVVPAGRLGLPEEIGELVSYLANMKGSFHTGKSLNLREVGLLLPQGQSRIIEPNKGFQRSAYRGR